MEDLSLNNINPNADVSIPADSKGLIRKFQKNRDFFDIFCSKNVCYCFVTV